MLLKTKRQEYELMENSHKNIIKIDTLSGNPLVCINSWDYKSDLDKVSFKTTTEVIRKHPLLKVKHIDLLPVTAKKIWRITVLRRPQSEMLNENNSYED